MTGFNGSIIFCTANVFAPSTNLPRPDVTVLYLLVKFLPRFENPFDIPSLLSTNLAVSRAFPPTNTAPSRVFLPRKSVAC